MMQPLSEAPTDVLQKARGIIFDIDDTVTDAGRLQRTAFDAMWRAKEAHLKLIAITGRPLGWADVVARHWPVDVALGENGAGWAWIDDGHFRVGYFADAQAQRAQRTTLDSICAAVRAQFPQVKLASDSVARRCDLAFDAFEEAQLPADVVAGVSELIRSHGAKCFVSSVHIHAVPGNWDKALGCQRAAQKVLGEDLKTSNAEWWFIGDSGNDQAAFAFFDNSVGVANIVEHLARIKKTPQYVTHKPRGEGFAELVDTILSARSR